MIAPALKIAVFGATGLTGGLVVAQALEQGHEVVALVRDPNRVSLRHPRLTVLAGHPTAQGDVERCVAGADVVIHCLGIGGKGDGKPTTLVSDSVKAALAAMVKHGVPRIVCMSNIGVGGSGMWLVNRLIPLFARWLLPILEDKERMEAALRESSVEWVSVRLPGIFEGSEKPVRVSEDGRGLGFTITAASIARFLLARTTGADFLRATPSISN